MKCTKKQQGWAAALALLLLVTPTAAWFGAEEIAAQTSGTALVAQELSLRTYRNIPYQAEFLSAGGETVTYAVDQAPKHGAVAVSGAAFVYTPDPNRTGTDRFTYVAEDAAGNVSAPATVSVTVSKTKSGVTYADLIDHPAAAAAQQLAEEGIFTGAQIGGQYFFEPERTVSRNEFLAMTMETAALNATAVSITGFSDDDAIPTWAKAYAAAGLSDGLVQGTPTEKGPALRGADPVTFNEAAAILNRALSVSDVDLETWYADREATPSWAAQAVGNMESVSVLAAGSFGSAALENTVTRADAAQMLSAARTLLEGKPVGLFDWLS